MIEIWYYRFKITKDIKEKEQKTHKNFVEYAIENSLSLK